MTKDKTFKGKLYIVAREFNNLAKSHDKNRVMERRVSKKLEKSLEEYYDNLERTVAYLMSKNSITVLKGIISKFGKESEEND